MIAIVCYYCIYYHHTYQYYYYYYYYYYYFIKNNRDATSTAAYLMCDAKCDPYKGSCNIASAIQVAMQVGKVDANPQISFFG